MIDWMKKIKFENGTPARLVGTLNTGDSDRPHRLVVKVNYDGSDGKTIYRCYEDGSSVFGDDYQVINDLPKFSKDNLVFLGYHLYTFKAGPVTRVSDHRGLWLYEGDSIYDVVHNDKFFYQAWINLSVGNIILFRYTDDDDVKRIFSLLVVECDNFYVKVKIDDDGKVFTQSKCGG